MVRELVPHVWSARQLGRGFGERTGFSGAISALARTTAPRSLQGFQGSREDQKARREQKARRIRRLAGTTGSCKDQKEPEEARQEQQTLFRTHRSTPFVAQGSALRSAPFFAPPPPPPFEALQERSRRGAFLLPGRVTPRIHHSGASCSTPSPFSPSATTIRLKIQAGEIRAGDTLPGPRRSLCCSYPASFTRPAEIVAARCV